MSVEDANLWSKVLSEQAQVLAFFGGLGGSVRALVLKTNLWESIRAVSVGSITSFSVGALAPSIIRPWFGGFPEVSDGAFGTLCASAFLLGMLAMTVMERAIDRKGEGQ